MSPVTLPPGVPPLTVEDAQRLHFSTLTLHEERAAAYALGASRARETDRPIDMVLHCPECGLQHIDEPERSLGPGNTERLDWENPPHRSHLCHGCGHIWRPADVPTNGVPAVKTKGKADSPIAQPKEVSTT